MERCEHLDVRGPNPPRSKLGTLTRVFVIVSLNDRALQASKVKGDVATDVTQGDTGNSGIKHRAKCGSAPPPHTALQLAPGPTACNARQHLGLHTGHTTRSAWYTREEGQDREAQEEVWRARTSGQHSQGA